MSKAESNSAFTSENGDNLLLSKPDISVKCRIGVFDHIDDYVNHDYLKKHVETIQKSGADHVILHARPVILSGLSPLKNRKSTFIPFKYKFNNQTHICKRICFL